MKRLLLSFLVLAAIGNCLANGQAVNVAAFQGGLNSKAINTCYKKMESFCRAEKKRGAWPSYVECIIPKMEQEKNCLQPLALIKTATRYLNPKFKTVKNYGPVSLVQASVIMADKSSATFLISNNGDFVDVEGANLDLKNAKNYEDFVKKYPHIEKFDLMLNPKVVPMGRAGTRFIFVREINDGCRACPTVGYAQEAYDFDKNGKFQVADVIEVLEKK